VLCGPLLRVAKISPFFAFTGDPMTSGSAHTLQPATHVRWGILACIVMVTVLTYLDRLNLSIAGRYIQDELALSTQTMGWVFSAFLLGYSLFQIPAGWAGDRYGPKQVMTAAILLWSVFTALTGLAPSLILHRWIGMAGSLMLVRFLVGVGEAANSPNNNKIVANWIGSDHRGIGSSFTVLGIGIGGVFTPPLIAWIMRHWGWRSSFYVSGFLGLFVVLVWQWYVANAPEEHRNVNAAELQLIHQGRRDKSKDGATASTPPWKKMLSNRSVWGILLGYLCQGFPIYFYHTWFFIYLVRVRHLSIVQGGLWGATPYLAIALLSPTGGWFSDFAASKLGRRTGRRLAVCVGMVTSAVLIWVGGAADTSTAAIALLALGAGFNLFAATTFWATCIDVTEEFTGSLSGLMNTFGNLGGWLSPIVSAYVATHFGWDRALDCAAVVSIASALFFLPVRADQKVDRVETALGVPQMSVSPVSSEP
jgi:MFS transporter, ACS family, glucarate transporter